MSERSRPTGDRSRWKAQKWTSGRITLNGTTVNAPDARALAEFYAGLTGDVVPMQMHLDFLAAGADSES